MYQDFDVIESRMSKVIANTLLEAGEKYENVTEFSREIAQRCLSAFQRELQKVKTLNLLHHN